MRGSPVVHVRFPGSERDRLDRLVGKLGKDRSSVLRLAVDMLYASVYDTGHRDSRVERPVGGAPSSPSPVRSAGPDVEDDDR